MKKNLCLLMAVLMSLLEVTPAFASAREERLRSVGFSNAGSRDATLTGYTTRIEGTLTQRGNDFYYVLPDGTDLKNGFVDGDYYSWTGARVKNYAKTANQAVYNTAYSGKDYTDYPYEATNTWVTLDYTNFTVKGIDTSIVVESFAWMDTVAQEAVKLDEISRVRYIADAVAGRLSYGQAASSTNLAAQSCQDNYIYAAYTGTAQCQAYGELFAAICRKSGLAVTNIFGVAANGESHMWNYVRVDGEWLYADITYYDTHGPAFLLQKSLFPGYETDADIEQRIIIGF